MDGVYYTRDTHRLYSVKRRVISTAFSAPAEYSNYSKASGGKDDVLVSDITPADNRNKSFSAKNHTKNRTAVKSARDRPCQLLNCFYTMLQ